MSLLTLLSPEQLHYLLRDVFATTRAAGAVNGTPADPLGGLWSGTRLVNDVGGMISIDANGLAVAGGNGSNYANTRLYASPTFARVPGLGLLCKVNVGADANTAILGWADGTLSHISGFNIGNGFSGGSTGSLPYKVVPYPTVAGDLDFGVIVRTIGSFYFYRDIGKHMALVLVDTVQTASPVQPGMYNFNKAFHLRKWEVERAYYLPSPLVSDGFGTDGISDGLGHAEGIAGGVGAGGSGRVWTADYGTFAATDGKLTCTALASGRGMATVDVDNPNMVIIAKIGWVAGEAGIVIRKTSLVGFDDYIKVFYDGTRYWLQEISQNTTALNRDIFTLVAGDGIVQINLYNDKISWYFPGGQGGGVRLNAQIANGELMSGTKVGFWTTDIQNTLDDLVVYPSGANGEYEFLANELGDYDATWMAGVTFVLFDGDSHSSNNLATSRYPRIVLNSLGAPYTGYTVGVGGQQVDDMVADMDTDVLPRLDLRYGQIIMVVSGGANDLGDSSLSAADVFNRKATYIDAVRAVCPAVQIVVDTCTPSGADATRETRRISYNTYVRDHYTEIADALADVGGDATIGAPGSQDNLTYYDAGKAHLTVAGYTIWAGLVQTAIAGLA